MNNSFNQWNFTKNKPIIPRHYIGLTEISIFNTYLTTLKLKNIQPNLKITDPREARDVFLVSFILQEHLADDDASSLWHIAKDIHKLGVLFSFTR